MDQIIVQAFNNAVKSHLELYYEYDFIHEVIRITSIYGGIGDDHTVIDYRGVNGEYGELRIDLPAEKFVREVLG